VSGQGRQHRSEERARSGPPRGSEPTTPSGQETQPERTVLSWQRTGLGVLGGLAPVRVRAVERALARGTGVAVPRLALVVTAVVVAVAGAALVAVLSPR
jgi:putative membrane protein